MKRTMTRHTVLLGILLLQVGMSWEGHLFGFVGGGLAAFLLDRRPYRSVRHGNLCMEQ